MIGEGHSMLPFGEEKSSVVMKPSGGPAREEELLTAFARLTVRRTLAFSLFLDTLTDVTDMDVLVLSCYDSEEVQHGLDKLRRQGNQVDELAFGNTVLDLASGRLVCGEKAVRLSAREFDVMRLLLQSQDRNLSKEVILARVWGYDSNAVENHVEVYVGFLRKKLKSIGSNIRIEAVRRLGYHLEVGTSC